MLLLKRFWWDLRDPWVRFQMKLVVLGNLPGQFGVQIRRRVLTKYFASAGRGIQIFQGLRIRGPHQLSVGDYTHIGVDNFLQCSGGLTLGKYVLLGPGVKIWTVNHRFDDPTVPIHEQGYDYEKVVIGDGCWLGANVFVFPGVVLPEGCIVSANSVVAKKKYPAWSILAGYPARVIGKRRHKHSDTTPEAVAASPDPAAPDRD